MNTLSSGTHTPLSYAQSCIFSLFLVFSLTHTIESQAATTPLPISETMTDNESLSATLNPDIRRAIHKLRQQGLQYHHHAMVINTQTQELYVIHHFRINASYTVSTSKYGTGNKRNSHQTPLGTHRVCQKHGNNLPSGTILKGMKSTNHIAPIRTAPVDLPHDYITSRILRLSGREQGINVGDNVDTYHRHIYIHGTNEEGIIGTPASGGCIRMKNKDVITLFHLMQQGTLVEII